LNQTEPMMQIPAHFGSQISQFSSAGQTIWYCLFLFCLTQNNS